MEKYDLAQYLVNLYTLMDAQSKGQHSTPSTVFVGEYTRAWDQLKDIINKEQENARQSTDNAERTQTGTGRSSGEPGRG